MVEVLSSGHALARIEGQSVRAGYPFEAMECRLLASRSQAREILGADEQALAGSIAPDYP